MRHLLHDPAFPDMVGEWAAQEAAAAALATGPANDNSRDIEDELSDPFLEAAVRLEIAATRLW
jgi:hypothetical protein